MRHYITNASVVISEEMFLSRVKDSSRLHFFFQHLMVSSNQTFHKGFQQASYLLAVIHFILRKYHPKSIFEGNAWPHINPLGGKHHVLIILQPLQSSKRVPMSLGLPEDVNLSPASMRADLWLWEVSAESWAKQQGQSRHTLPAGELNQIFSLLQNNLKSAEVLLCIIPVFFSPAAFYSSCSINYFALLQSKTVTIVFTGSWASSSKQTSSQWRPSKVLEAVLPQAKLLSGPGSPPAPEVQIFGCCWLLSVSESCFICGNGQFILSDQRIFNPALVFEHLVYFVSYADHKLSRLILFLHKSKSRRNESWCKFYVRLKVCSDRKHESVN